MASASRTRSTGHRSQTKTRPAPTSGLKAAAKQHIDVLTAELTALDKQRALGDVRDRAYLKRHDELLRELAHNKVRAQLESGEEILAEHHFMQAHFPFTKLALQDVSQEVVSVYATSRRLFRWHYLEEPKSQAQWSGEAGTLETLAYTQIREVAQRREYRRGEALVAVVMLIVAALLWPLLEITGPLLVGIGLLALLHVGLMPTRYTLVASASGKKEWRIYAPNKQTGRQLRAIVDERLDRSPGSRS
ncbi:MAG: hypothetical protein ACYC1C_21915 [Chloroflexota bacterium]